jgi:hypothetical protein
MSGTGESISHARTEDARRTDDGNPAAARANPDLSLTGHTNMNGHEDRSPPDSGAKDGQHTTYMAPDEDADYTYIWTQRSLSKPPSHTQAPSREEAMINRLTRK